MTRRLLVTVAAAAFGLAGAAPALASQPYHVNFKNFALDASDSTRDGTVLNNGSLQLASSGLVWRLARAVNVKMLRQTSEPRCRGRVRSLGAIPLSFLCYEN